jgi:hypothetical protein
MVDRAPVPVSGLVIDTASSAPFGSVVLFEPAVTRTDRKAVRHSAA